MEIQYSTLAIKFCCCAFVIALAVSCGRDQGGLSAETRNLVTDSSNSLMNHIARDISAKGPIAWVNYFEDAPGFFMASGGQLAFKDHRSAVSFVKNTLVKTMPQIKLSWQNVKIDPITEDYSAIGADFHEDITLANGTTMPFEGYFTAVAHFDGISWKLRNLHWSIKASDTAGK